MAKDFDDWLNTAAGLSDYAEGLLHSIYADHGDRYFERIALVRPMYELVQAGYLSLVVRPEGLKLKITNKGLDRVQEWLKLMR